MQRRRVVLIDEAYRMNEAALERLGQLGKCALVLAGLPDPGPDPGDDGPGEPSTAVATVVRLAAVPPNEVGAFVAVRLAQSGVGKDFVNREAVARLAERSGGIPRVLNALASAAVFLARAERAPRVKAAHVDQAAVLRDGDAGMGAAGPAVPIVPGVVPCRPAEASASSVVAPLPAPVGGGQASRRWHVAALSVIVGVAAACGGIVAWNGGHARHASPSLAAAGPAPTPPGPVAPLPYSGTSSAAPTTTAMAQAKIAVPPERATGGQVAAPPAPQAAPAAPSSTVAAAAPLSVASPSPGPEALPSSAPVHVALRYPRGSADADAWAENLARALRAAGFAVDTLVPVSPRDARSGARYFFAEDQGAAEAVLRAVGLPGKGSLAGATGLGASLRPGLIELTVPPSQFEAAGRLGPPNAGRS